MPRSSTTVWAMNDVVGQQKLRPRGTSTMLPLSPRLKDAFDKFEQDFQAANLPKDKYIKTPASTSSEDKLQELNSDFAKIYLPY